MWVYRAILIQITGWFLRIRKCGHAGRGVSLGVSFEVSKANTRSSLSFSCDIHRIDSPSETVSKPQINALCFNCLAQSVSLTAIAQEPRHIQKHPHWHTQNIVWPNIWVPHGSFKLLCEVHCRTKASSCSVVITMKNQDSNTPITCHYVFLVL